MSGPFGGLSISEKTFVISDVALRILCLLVLQNDLQVIHRSILNCFPHCIVLNINLGAGLQSVLNLRSTLSLFVLRFCDSVNPIGSWRPQSINRAFTGQALSSKRLTSQKLTIALFESAEGKNGNRKYCPHCPSTSPNDTQYQSC